MNIWLRNSILMVLMLVSSGMAVALRPTHKIADQGPKVELESMIPRSFSDWREEKQTSAQIVDPQTAEMVRKIYSQTLARTYVNGNGYRIMLSIAYGNDQTDTNQLHKPEVCYPAQGFVLQNKQGGNLATSNGLIPLTRILTSLGPRIEPVTYWTTIGDRVVHGGFNKKMIEMGYGLSGKIPDGILFRVSSIDPDTERAYSIQNQFSIQMLDAMAPEQRLKLTGNLQLN